MMRSYQPKRTYRPKNSNGNLYYIRISTHLGYFYKIGFTTKDSVEKRFSYKSKDFYEDNKDFLFDYLDGAYEIDKVLLFEHLDNAYEIEQQLHACLSQRALFKEFEKQHAAYPLFKNGQSELYLEDILNLDPEYTEARRFKTFRNVKLAIESNEFIGTLKFDTMIAAKRLLRIYALPFSVYSKKKSGMSTQQAIEESIDNIASDGLIQKQHEDNNLTEQAYVILASAGINLHNKRSDDF